MQHLLGRWKKQRRHVFPTKCGFITGTFVTTLFSRVPLLHAVSQRPRKILQSTEESPAFKDSGRENSVKVVSVL